MAEIKIDQSARANRDFAFREKFAEFFNGAAHAFLRGFVADAEGLRHFLRGLAFKITQQQRVTVRFAQLAQRGIELRRDLFPTGFGFPGNQFIHGGSLLFTGATAHIGANGLRGNVPGGAMQPTRQHRTICELNGLFGERDKYALRHVFRQMRVTNHPQRGGINEIHMAAHQFGKRRFGAMFGVGAEQL